MKQVNLYFKNQHKGAGKNTRKGVYILEMITTTEPVTLTGYLTTEDCTKNKADILILIKALERIKMPVSLVIYTNNPYILTCLEKRKKQQENWKNQKGESITNIEEWMKVDNLLKPHTYNAVQGSHSYLNWMDEQLNERIEKK